MTYEIVNPSDPYTLEADELDVAAVALTLLGGGKYALADADEQTVVPLFLFGHGHDEWAQEHYGETFETMMERVHREKLPALIACLESVTIGSRDERQQYEDALTYITEPAKREAYTAQWHDKHRSSLNDIGGRAHDWAKQLRQQEAKQ